jgi:hypothetical protein
MYDQWWAEYLAYLPNGFGQQRGFACLHDGLLHAASSDYQRLTDIADGEGGGYVSFSFSLPPALRKPSLEDLFFMGGAYDRVRYRHIMMLFSVTRKEFICYMHTTLCCLAKLDDTKCFSAHIS